MAIRQQKQGFGGIESPDGTLSLEFCPTAGGSISRFQLQRDGQVIDLFRPYDETQEAAPQNMASFPLTPYSNRIINGRLNVGGKTHNIGPLHPPEPHQLHGDGWLLPWLQARVERHFAVLKLRTEKSSSTPYVYEARQTFTLENNRLEIAMDITNRSGITLPFGLGHHPYFLRNDQTVLKARLPKVWTSWKMVPDELVDVPDEWDFSKGIALSDAHFSPPAQGFQGADLLDHCFQGWNRTAEITWPDSATRLTIKAEPVFANFVIYIPSRKNFFCAEPVTNINDGFNLLEKGVADTGTVILKDGETLKGKIWFEVGAA